MGNNEEYLVLVEPNRYCLQPLFIIFWPNLKSDLCADIVKKIPPPPPLQTSTPMKVVELVFYNYRARTHTFFWLEMLK